MPQIRSDNLRSDNVSAVSHAIDRFGEDGTLIVARSGHRLCNPIYFTVPEGYYALVTKFGAEKKFQGKATWPAGIHVKPPWYKVSHLVTKQSFVFNTSIRECKTKDNVSCSIDIALIMRIRGEDPSIHPNDDPEYVRKFVHEVTAEGLAQQIRDSEAEAVRKLTRSVYHTEVFGLRSVSGAELASTISPIIDGVGGSEVPSESVVAVPVPEDETMAPESPNTDPFIGNATNRERTSDGDDITKEERKDLIGDHDESDKLEAAYATEFGANVTDAMRNRMNAQFMPQGVEILDVIIEKIELPDLIQNQMTKKTLVISKNAEQRMQHKFSMMELAQKEELKALQQSHGERKAEAIEHGKEQVLKQQNKLNMIKAEGQRVVSYIDTENSINNGMIHWKGEHTVQKINLQSKIEVESIKLEAQSRSTKQETDANYEVNVVESKSELESANLKAKGDALMYNAHGTVAPMIRTLNNHLTEKKRLEVNDCLASNSKVTITGTSGGEAANKMILADAALAKANNSALFKPSRSEMISELAVASGKAKVRLVNQ